MFGFFKPNKGIAKSDQLAPPRQPTTLVDAIGTFKNLVEKPPADPNAREEQRAELESVFNDFKLSYQTEISQVSLAIHESMLEGTERLKQKPISSDFGKERISLDLKILAAEVQSKRRRLLLLQEHDAIISKILKKLEAVPSSNQS